MGDSNHALENGVQTSEVPLRPPSNGQPRKKRLLLNAFDMNGIGHISPGQWRNPVDQSKHKNRLDYWINLAKLLDRGKFNALFLADNFGSHDVYTGSHDPAIRAGTQWPMYDPFVIISAMAAVTKNLAFGVTSCTTFETPFLLAKRFSTLDHISNGRIAWNIVTSWSDNAARAVGLEELPEHDLRYDMAEEYLNLMYKLWEGSWAEDAVVQDSERATYTEPSKVRKITHRGKFFKCESAHLVDPSPQRTPVLFQAGMSTAGATFGAKHAECIFIGGRNPAFVRGKIDETRRLAASQGRNPSDLKFFVQFTPILGMTDEEAQAKLEDFRQYAIPEGGLALFCGISKIDVSKFPIDEEFPKDHDDPVYKGLGPRHIEALMHKPDGFDKWTPRSLGNFQAIGGSGTFIAGSAATVADEMERWINVGGVDGFNVGHVVVPGAWEDVVDLLIPELERRGYNQDYPVENGTARENLYATPGDAKVRKDHPGSKFAFDQYGKTWE